MGSFRVGKASMMTGSRFFKGMALVLALFLVTSTACVSKAAFEELQTQLSQNRQQLSAQQAETARLTSALTQEQVKLKELSTQLLTIQGELSSTQNKASNLESQITIVKADLSSTQNRASILESQLTGTKAELSTAQSKASGLDKQVLSLQSSLDAEKQTASQLSSQLTQAKNTNTTLGQQLDNLKSELSQAKKAITALNPTTLSIPGTSASKDTTISSKTSTNLGDSIILTYEPAQPVTGRPVRFSLEGLTPWSSFNVTFVNPGGMPVDWIDETETFYTKTGSQEFLKTNNLFADGNGKSSWVRPNILETEGQWTIKINVDSKTYEGRYTLIPLQMQINTLPYLGVSFRQYSGSISEVYATAGVPLALALDLSGTLYFINESLKPWLGQSYVQIPNLYLLFNRELFNKALISAGKMPNGFEAGTFVPGKYRGIYIIADSLKSEMMKILIHEYTHLIIDEIAPNTEIPAWLNEGVATYLELHVGPEFGAGLRAQRDVFSRADDVYVNLVRNSVFTFSQLKSQKDWNTQTNKERLNLQYSQAYMAVRYMLERFGNQSVALILSEMKNGQSFDTAFQKITGVSIATFEQDWLNWQRSWKDSNRELVRQYVGQVETITQGISALNSDRANFLRVSGSMSFSSRIPTQTQFVSRAVVLESKAIALTPPPMLKDFHGELSTFVSVYKRWLQIALDAFKQESNTLIDQSNAMIPEVNGRENRLRTQLYDVKFDWGLTK
ncbi:MAG: hypothetical protein HW384_1023 [Dehalococcoidia bacterium]|nr:hypothetical protein [Dehalococcoidia bacterium]